jgi:undecaprenyl-diphosphatase
MTGTGGVSDIVAAGILGLVEGVTEFIPVSSTGHLILAGEWLGRSGETWKTFEVVIQLGAILAVVWRYRALFLEVARGLGRTPQSRKFVLNLMAGFLPAAVVGLAARDFIKAHLFQGSTVAWGLILGAGYILVIERLRPVTTVDSAEAIPLRIAFGVGLAQILALFPGFSRSGATIMGAYALGCSRKAAAEFSFFLAVPVMFAASGLDLYKSRHLLTMADLPIFTAGMIVAFGSALLVLKAFIRFVSSRSFTPFAWYRLLLGAVILLLSSRAG